MKKVTWKHVRIVAGVGALIAAILIIMFLVESTPEHRAYQARLVEEIRREHAARAAAEKAEAEATAEKAAKVEAVLEGLVDSWVEVGEAAILAKGAPMCAALEEAIAWRAGAAARCVPVTATEPVVVLFVARDAQTFPYAYHVRFANAVPITEGWTVFGGIKRLTPERAAAAGKAIASEAAAAPQP